MESSKLKNIVLLILLITNVLLLLLLGSQRLALRRSGDQALTDAVALLADKGISVSEDVLPRTNFAPVLDVERDAAWEQAVFTRLLGTNTVFTQRGLVTYYVGPNGRAEVRGDGAFSVTLNAGVYAGSDPAALCQAALAALDITGQVRPDGAAGAAILQTWEGAPIYSCSVTYDFDGANLTAFSGHRLVGVPTKPAPEAQPLSLATLLTAFRSHIILTGDACNAILELSQGYLLTSSSGSLQLTPVLRVVTDANRYYVNALTGDVTRL